MATVSENLQTIVDCKIAIKQAIIDKGGQVGNDLTTYAAAIASLPSGGGEGGIASERVTYIRRKGDGYIMTGVPGANSDLSISITYSINTFPAGYYSLIHAYKGEAYNATRFFIYNRSSILGALNSKASDSVALKTTMVEGVIYTGKIEPSGTSMKLSANGESASKVRASGEPLDRELQIFPTATDDTDICIYHISIYDKDVIVRNFVPYRENGKFGLWDAVEKKFYASEAGDFSGEVVELPNSGCGDPNPTAEKNDVTFYDYDGTIRYSYTAEEFLALTEMPPLPTQKGLICQEWNWSFEDAREYVAEYGILDVGATYITDDGKTRLYIRIAAEGRMEVPLYFRQTKANGVTIDWGDNTATETLDGTDKVNTTHRYASIGDYVISLDVADGCTLGFGNSTTTYSVMGSTETSNSGYRTTLQRVEVGKNVTVLNVASFKECYALTNISIPKDVALIDNNCFSSCYSLRSAVLPSAINLLSPQVFRECYSLHLISMPANVNRLGSYAMYMSRSLCSIVLSARLTHVDMSSIDSNRSVTSIIIPASVTDIGSSAMGYNYSVAFYDFSHHTAVPTLANTNAFTSIPEDCKIIVPDALYDEWIAATNWSTYSDYIIKKTDWDNR